MGLLIFICIAAVFANVFYLMALLSIGFVFGLFIGISLIDIFFVIAVLLAIFS